jgi:hypothetical protein
MLPIGWNRRSCHSERSEESPQWSFFVSTAEILRSAQNDKPLLVSQEASQSAIAYPVGGFGTGGGRAWAFTSDWNGICLWVPSQKGLVADCPQRQSEIKVRPAKSKALPSASQIVNSPSTRSEPFLFTVIFIDAPPKGNFVEAAFVSTPGPPLALP